MIWAAHTWMLAAELWRLAGQEGKNPQHSSGGKIPQAIASGVGGEQRLLPARLDSTCRLNVSHWPWCSVPPLKIPI